MTSPVNSIDSFGGYINGDDRADDYFEENNSTYEDDMLDSDYMPDMDNIEIDMDNEPVIQPIKEVITFKPPPKKIIITKKYINKVINTTGKPSQKQNQDNDLEPDIGVDLDSGKKIKKADVCLEINPETIDFYSKDIQLNRDCCKKSLCRNDTGVICLLLKLGFIKDYRCSNKKCKIAKTWLDKQIQLLLNRKNGKFDDLTPANLELLCPNCYMITYGQELFMKMIDKTVFKCKLCQYPLNSCGGKRKKSGYCVFCENKMINTAYHKNQTDYLAELNHSNNPSYMNKNDEHDNFSSTAYYNEVSKFKSFKPINNNCSVNSLEDTKLSKLVAKPLIKLNMTIPDLADLIDERIDD
jgi:hypothetical protein